MKVFRSPWVSLFRLDHVKSRLVIRLSNLHDHFYEEDLGGYFTESLVSTLKLIEKAVAVNTSK